MEMEYNSQKDELIIPEYGRNVQNLIRYAKTIEDDKHRQQFVEQIIELMMQMHPQNRNMEDYKEKLWKHAFRIADYDLRVKAPNGLIPSIADTMKKPDRVEYPVRDAKYRHYGNNVQRLIARALEMPLGPKRDGFVATIASYMKLAYRTWNKEHFVSDEVIKTDLEALSEGRLTLSENTSIENLTNANNSSSINRRRPNPTTNNRQGGTYRSNNYGSRDGRSEGGRDNRDTRDSRDSREGRDSRDGNGGGRSFGNNRPNKNFNQPRTNNKRK